MTVSIEAVTGDSDDVVRYPCNFARRWQTRSSVSVAALLSSIPETESVGDPSATRTVYITIGLLVALGVALAVLAVWLWRRTRPEPQLFAPLEEMETRSWRKQDPAGQRRALDASRPPGALPVRREAAEPAVDTDFGSERPVVGFDDLADGVSGDPEPADSSEDIVDEPDSAESSEEGEGPDGEPVPDEHDADADNADDANEANDTDDADDADDDGADSESDTGQSVDEAARDDSGDTDPSDDETAEQAMPEQDLLDPQANI